MSQKANKSNRQPNNNNNNYSNSISNMDDCQTNFTGGYSNLVVENSHKNFKKQNNNSKKIDNK